MPVIERIADELLDGVRSQLDSTDGCDLFTSFAHVLPCRMMREVLGIQGVEPAAPIRWSDASLELFRATPSLERQLELAEPVAEFHQ